MRITEKYLKEQAERIRAFCPQVIVQWAYGKPRAYDTLSHSELSWRLPNREMDAWLDGFSKGYEMAGRALEVDPWNGLVPAYMDAYDNGGQTIDRYTIVFRGPKGWCHVGSSSNPTHPQGFWQHGDGLPKPHALGEKIHLFALPAEVYRLALSEYKELYPREDNDD